MHMGPTGSKVCNSRKFIGESNRQIWKILSEQDLSELAPAALIQRDELVLCFIEIEDDDRKKQVQSRSEAVNASVKSANYQETN